MTDKIIPIGSVKEAKQLARNLGLIIRKKRGASAYQVYTKGEYYERVCSGEIADVLQELRKILNVLRSAYKPVSKPKS